jgi:hypothetical protein
VNKKGSRFVLPLKGLKDSPHFYFRARGEDYYTAVKIVTLVPAPAPTMITVDKDEPAYIYHRLRGVDQSPLAGQRHITRNLALATTGEVNTIDLPQGSDLTIHVELDRRLRSERSVTVENTPNLPKGFAGYPGKDPVLVGDRGFTLAMSKITRDHDFTVEFIDEDNIRGRRRFKLISTIDTEPQIGPLSLGVILRKPRFRQPTGEKDKPARDYSELTNSYLITAVAKLPFECSLKDDYGLVKVGYHYRYRPVDFELISSSSTTKVPVVEIEKSAGRIRDQLVNATIRLWPDHPFPGHVLPQRLMLPSYAGATADAVVSRFKTAAKFQEGYVPCIGFDKVLDRRSGEMILLQQLPSLLTKPSAARGWEFEFKDDLDGFDVGKTLPQFRAFDPEKMAQLHYQLQISVQATDNNVETGAIFDKITGMRGNTKKNPNGTINFLIVTENELLAQIALEEETLQDKVETAKEKVDASMVSLLEQQSKTRDPGTDMELVLGRMNEIKTAISTAGSNLLDVQTAYKNILIEMDINQVRPDRMASIKNNILNRLDQILDDPENASYPMAERDFLKAYDLVEKEASARQAPNAAAHEAKFNLAHQRLQVLSDRLNQLLGAMKQGLVEAQLVAILAGMEQKKRRDTALLNRLWLEEVERQLKSLIDDPKAPKSDEKKTSRMDFVPRPADQMTGIALWPVGAAPMRIESVLTARRREDRHEPLAWPPRN